MIMTLIDSLLVAGILVFLVVTYMLYERQLKLIAAVRTLKQKSNHPLGTLPVVSYDAGNGVTIERAKQKDGTTLWVVRDSPMCLDREGNWLYEPRPSSRDYDFIRETCFLTPDEAWEAYSLTLYKQK